jgi:RAQPRD family integrative conjugative element protein
VTKRQTGLATRGRTAFALTLALSLIAGFSSWAGDESMERERLAAVLRELDAIERLVREGESVALTQGTRYHFDYAQLRGDLARVRVGIAEYLAPARAQPRDLQALHGDYQREAATP